MPKTIKNPGLVDLHTAFGETTAAIAEPPAEVPTEPQPPAVAPAPAPVAEATPAPEATPTQPNIDELIAQARRDGQEHGRREMDAAYKGIQRVVSDRDRELFQLRQQNAQLAAQTAQLPVMANELDELFRRNVGPEEAERIRLKAENENFRRQLEERGAPEYPQGYPQYPQPAVYSLPPVDEATKKREVMEFWYPGESIDVDDTRIDWAKDIVDTNPLAAQARFKKSVVKLMKEDAAKAVQATATQQVRQAENRLRDAGVDTTDGSLPTGNPLGTLAAQRPEIYGADPKQWKPTRMFREAFENPQPNGKATRLGR